MYIIYRVYIYTYRQQQKTTLKILDLTNLPYNKECINLLCRGFSFTPTPGPNEVELKIDAG